MMLPHCKYEEKYSSLRPLLLRLKQMHFILHFLSVTQSKYKVITCIRFSHLDAFYKAQGGMAAVWSDSSHSKVDR